MYGFAIVDPRNVPAAEEANNKVFANPVYGIEVTVPALASRCYFNLDPQHSGADANRAAIEDALTAELPLEGSTLATVRPDLDAVGAMAIFDLRAMNKILEPAMERIAIIAEADKFNRGGWPGQKPLPTPYNWSVVEYALAAIAMAVSDFKVPLAERVALMEKWLLEGEEPKQYRDSVMKERCDLITAIETGRIRHEKRSNGRIAVVESTHRGATNVGYCLAPVVVALNPSFKQGAGEPFRKFTICAYEAKWCDIQTALVELAELEPGWGGSPTIGGSPQGVSSRLTIDEVVAVVEKHLR